MMLVLVLVLVLYGEESTEYGIERSGRRGITVGRTRREEEEEEEEALLPKRLLIDAGVTGFCMA